MANEVESNINESQVLNNTSSQPNLSQVKSLSANISQSPSKTKSPNSITITAIARDTKHCKSVQLYDMNANAEDTLNLGTDDLDESKHWTQSDVDQLMAKHQQQSKELIKLQKELEAIKSKQSERTNNAQIE